MSSRLAWNADQLPDHVRAALMGPGSPFELVTESVRGTELEVWARRPRHLRACFDATVASQGDAPSMVSGDRTWTFAEALADVEKLSRVLSERYGIGRGDRVGIVSANSPEHGLAMWAAISLGAVVAGLNGWWTGAELALGIGLAEPSIILGDPPRLARLEPGSVPEGVAVVTLEDLYAEALELGDGGRSWAVEPDEDDPAIILFTSGTTGNSKGATISHRNIIHFGWANRFVGAVGAMLAGGAPGGQAATILASPMFHVSGMLAMLSTGPMLGSKLVFPSPGRWDPTEYLRLTEQHRVTAWSGVPTQYWRILREADFDSYDLSSVKVASSGGAVFSPELIRELTVKMPSVALGNGYGMSETMGMGTRIGGPQMAAVPDSVGAPNPTVEIEIRDPFGETLPEGEVGEIHLRGACVFLGYWRNPAATEACLSPELWYRTGDFCRISSGLLFLESRMRDLIIRGGENIYPIEIENRLVEHPDINDAAVIGVDHVELGQEVKAFVVLRPGAELTAAEVQAFAAERLARFKVPAHVEFRDALPYTETGKVLKNQLEREQSAP